jgi:nuclear GTP-binding protein
MAKFINKPKHRTSKRQNLNMKYKITKKVAEHNKRVKKEARKLKALGMIKKSKQP